MHSVIVVLLLQASTCTPTPLTSRSLQIACLQLLNNPNLTTIMKEEIGLLANWSRYGFDYPVYGTVEPSSDFDPAKRLLNFGSGRWVEVDTTDIIMVENLHPKEVEFLMPD